MTEICQMLLILRGICYQYCLNEPSSLKFGAKVRIYVELTTVTSYSTEAKIIKMENQ